MADKEIVYAELDWTHWRDPEHLEDCRNPSGNCSCPLPYRNLTPYDQPEIIYHEIDVLKTYYFRKLKHIRAARRRPLPN
jgi:hypothetical protein